MTALETLQPDVTIVKPISDYRDPIMEICYEPSPPNLTVRSIIAVIVSAEPTSFSVSIYHPPTLEQRTRSMQLHEQRALLLRLFFTFIIAIPTFIIGIVYMTLVHSSQTKQYLMAPMWNGNASRTEWALFFLATPVYFYGAGLFHRRSIKEIRALWKKGSTTPIMKRFTKFGSMNLLVGTAFVLALSLELMSCVDRFLAEYLWLTFRQSRFSLLQQQSPLQVVVQVQTRHILIPWCS